MLETLGDMKKLPADTELEDEFFWGLMQLILKPKDILFLKLIYQEEYSVEEIARIMKIYPATVYSRKHKILNRLKKSSVFREKIVSIK